jgi:hypothetical protein
MRAQSLNLTSNKHVLGAPRFLKEIEMAQLAKSATFLGVPRVSRELALDL